MPLTYANPVHSGYLADPFVLQHAGIYYAYGTGEGPEPDGSHFPVLRSDDLVTWDRLGGALPRSRARNGEPFTAYWAPEVAERAGRFYMYYSAGFAGRDETHRLRVAVADRPEGPFEDVGRLPISGALGDSFSIDANPFCDPKDGQWYLLFATDFFAHDRVGTGTVAVLLTKDMLSTEGEPQTVLRAGADWQIYERNRPLYGRIWGAWHTVEGPFAWCHNGLYYCFYSGGNWRTSTYGVGYGVAASPLGPYRDEWNADGPSVLSGIEGEVLGPGHNSIVVGPDGETELLVYHAWDRSLTARRMCIDPLLWVRDDENGFDRPRCAGPTLGRQSLVHRKRDLAL